MSIFVSYFGEKKIWWQMFVWESRWYLRVRARVWDRPKKDYAQTHTMCVSHLTGQSKIKAYFGINSKPLLKMSFKFLLIKDARFLRPVAKMSPTVTVGPGVNSSTRNFWFYYIKNLNKLSKFMVRNFLSHCNIKMR